VVSKTSALAPNRESGVGANVRASFHLLCPEKIFVDSGRLRKDSSYLFATADTPADFVEPLFAPSSGFDLPFLKSAAHMAIFP